MQQSSISPGRLNTAGVDRNQGKHWLVYAGATIVAGQLVKATGTVSNAPAVILADADAVFAAQSPIWVAVHGATSGQPLRVSQMFMLNNQNTSSAVLAGDPVYLSDTAGGWSLTAGTAKRQVGTVLVKDATVGSIILNPGEYGPSVVDAVVNTVPSAAIDGTVETPTLFDKTRTIKANRLRVGSQIRIRAIGVHTVTTGAETHDMALMLGTVSLASRATIDPANNDIFLFDVTVAVRTIGASGTIVAVGSMCFGVSGTANPVGVLKGSTAIDTTTDLVVGVQIDRQAAATDGDSARLEIISVDILD